MALKIKKSLMKKSLLIGSTFFLLSAGLMAQGSVGIPGKKNVFSKTKSSTERDYTKPLLKTGQKAARGCATPVPSPKWDEAFNAMVEQHKQDIKTGRTTATTYTIPIIFHIIHSSTEAVGSGHNVSQAQVNSQIPILNADYNGTGYNTSLYAAMTLNGHPAFYDYAVANSLPAPDNNGVVIASSGITFCLATKNASGTTLAEPGIDRVAWQSIAGATDPASSSNLNSLMDGTIKPATIWDPTRYFNVWVSDGGTSGLLGYATFPPATSSTPINPSWGETVSSPSTTDGVWMAYNALGNTGAAASPYNLGRTLTHESGHYFGLRHIWGDGSCVTDYCNDTPPAAAANYVNCGTAYPYHAGTCTGTPSNSPDGEMYMNFMDYSNDCGMWMFTTDQVNRFHTALSLSPWRSGLTASASNLCAGVTQTAPVAAFNYPSSICVTAPASFTDVTSGPPTSWAWSVNPNTGVTVNTSTVSNPSITFSNAGSYSVTLVATNTVGTSSVTNVVTVSSCSVTACDTLSNFLSTDTLTVYGPHIGVLPASDTGGYISGNNFYGDLAKAEYYKGTNLANSQINGVICLFFASGTLGTKGTGTVSLDILKDSSTAGAGPTGSPLGTATASIANITATTAVANVGYCGNTSLAFSSAIIIPYKFAFATPVLTPTVGFYASLNLPKTTGDTLVVFQNTQGGTAHTISTAWELNAGATPAWGSVQTDWGFTNPVSFAILPIVCPKTIGISQHNELAENIAFFPNPSNGRVNFAITLDAPSNLIISVVNTLGQAVFTKEESNVSHSVLTYDLSTLGRGVYFVNITDAKNNRVVKKMIIE